MADILQALAGKTSKISLRADLKKGQSLKLLC